MYLIETRNKRDPTWSTSGIGDNNNFICHSDAISMVEALKTMGDDWATAEYRIIEAHNTCNSCLDASDDGLPTYQQDTSIFGGVPLPRVRPLVNRLVDHECEHAHCACGCRGD